MLLLELFKAAFVGGGDMLLEAAVDNVVGFGLDLLNIFKDGSHLVASFPGEMFFEVFGLRC